MCALGWDDTMFYSVTVVVKVRSVLGVRHVSILWVDFFGFQLN